MSAAGGLHGELFADAELTAIFDDASTLQGMLDFEAALARAQADSGLIPQAAAEAIAACCDAGLYDIAAIGRAATLAGNPAIPLVKALTAEVARRDEAAARHVHLGATSQDVIDSGRAIQLGRACANILARIDRLAAALARLAERHRAMPMIGRTFLQQAVPIPFGVKLALWLDPLLTIREALLAQGEPAWQFAGAAGTLASLGDDAVAVQDAMRHRLGASEAMLVPWHGERDRLVRLAAEFGILAGHLGKVARDIGLMAQTEIGELAEPEAAGKGGSSAMPHKRNPVLCTLILAAATRAPGLVSTMLCAMPHEHERALGGWHAEWPTLPELAMVAGCALNHAIALVEGLQIFPERMRANIELTRGLVMSERVSLALAGTIGKSAAHHALEGASRRAIDENRHLRDVLADDPAIAAHLDAAALDALFDPVSYRGASDAIIDRVLARLTD